MRGRRTRATSARTLLPTQGWLSAVIGVQRSIGVGPAVDEDPGGRGKRPHERGRPGCVAGPANHVPFAVSISRLILLVRLHDTKRGQLRHLLVVTLHLDLRCASHNEEPPLVRWSLVVRSGQPLTSIRSGQYWVMPSPTPEHVGQVLLRGSVPVVSPPEVPGSAGAAVAVLDIDQPCIDLPVGI
jgi:hypothetical protein